MLPPHVYGTPTYWSAVPRTRAAVSVAAGDRGMRALVVRGEVVVRESDDVAREPMASPARTTAESTVDGDTANVPRAHPERRSTEHATMPPEVISAREVMPSPRQLRRHARAHSQDVTNQCFTFLRSRAPRDVLSAFDDKLNTVEWTTGIGATQQLNHGAIAPPDPQREREE